MKKVPSSRIARLEAARGGYGPGEAARVEKLLASFRGARFDDAESLIHFHDLLLFLRAFPQSRRVIALTEELLAVIAADVERLRQRDADLELFDSEEFSGIAGTAIRETFTYEVARWLASRYLPRLSVEWDMDEQAWQMSSSLPQIVPLLKDDCQVEADTPYLKWLSNAAGGEARILPWLLRRVEAMPLPILQKDGVVRRVEGQNKSGSWEIRPPAAPARGAILVSSYYHKTPLLQRKQVSLAEEFKSAAIPVRRLSRREGNELLDQAREALTVRYRELYGTTRGDPSQVIEADAGRGVYLYLWGMPPGPRLPLRAYYAGATFKNGVPINYFEAIGLCEWLEVGFNTFYAFREGETAWVYSKVLHLLHQIAGATCFSVYPYQIGQHNEEAIKSGAFWFYRKLGFRPGRAELLAMTEREEKKIAAKAGYRTSAATLRKLADDHMFYEVGDQPRGLWDTFSIRNIGFAVEQRMAAKFKGDPEAMRRESSAWLAKMLRVNLDSWSELERSTFSTSPLCWRWCRISSAGPTSSGTPSPRLSAPKLTPAKPIICGCCNSTAR